VLVFRIIWSVIAWLIAFISFVGVVVVSLPLSLFRQFETFQGGWPASIIGRTPLLTLSPFSVREDPRHDAKRVCLYVINHTSVLDGPVAVGALPHPICGIENAGHFLVPGYGWLMKMANAIPVHKGEGRTARLVSAARERVTRGISIVAFPEAHRTMDGNIRPFKRGVFFMARAVGIPVVPVAIRGLRRVLPKGTLVVTPGKLDVYIGPPLETKELSDAQVMNLAETARQIIVDYVEHGHTVDGVQIPARPAVPSAAGRLGSAPPV
jgi:1-acyl-sn-glycerol-3-phosphate acyltransferase